MLVMLFTYLSLSFFFFSTVKESLALITGEEKEYIYMSRNESTKHYESSAFLFAHETKPKKVVAKNMGIPKRKWRGKQQL